MSNEQVTVVKSNGDEVTLPYAEALELVNTGKAKALHLGEEAFLAAARERGFGIVTDDHAFAERAKAAGVHVQQPA